MSEEEKQAIEKLKSYISVFQEVLDEEEWYSFEEIESAKEYQETTIKILNIIEKQQKEIEEQQKKLDGFIDNIDLSKYLRCNDIKDFAVGIEHGCFYWKVELNDNKIYQIKYRIEKYKTIKGNRSQRKVYFINKDDKELIFDNEVNKRFKSFRYSYIRSGI